MSRLAEELQPLLTRATVIPELCWSNYYLLFQHHYQVYSVDNRRYENLFIVRHILYIISYIQMVHCLCSAAPIGLFLADMYFYFPGLEFSQYQVVCLSVAPRTLPILSHLSIAGGTLPIPSCLSVTGLGWFDLFCPTAAPMQHRCKEHVTMQASIFIFDF